MEACLRDATAHRCGDVESRKEASCFSGAYMGYASSTNSAFAGGARLSPLLRTFAHFLRAVEP